MLLNSRTRTHGNSPVIKWDDDTIWVINTRTYPVILRSLKLASQNFCRSIDLKHELSAQETFTRGWFGPDPILHCALTFYDPRKDMVLAAKASSMTSRT